MAKNKPVVAANHPIEVDLEKDKSYYFCRCGRSDNQPFCDGSHKGTGITPLEFQVDKNDAYWLCRCKQTGDAPFCDGTHSKVADDQVGKELLLHTKEHRDAMPAPSNTIEEPTVEFIHRLAREGLTKMGPHGEMDAMGVPRHSLPDWNDLQLLTAQLARRPLMEEASVDTTLVIGPEAKRPLTLEIPLFVSDMSYGALSPEAKISLAKGAEGAGTGICSGEGGMLPEEQAENRRYFLEYASAGFGYDEALLEKVQAFHFKGGQAAKTGTGGHLPAAKVSERIAEVRKIDVGQDAVSPAAFPELQTVEDFRRFADRVREVSGGIPIGFKLSAQHIEKDIAFAVDAGADYIILDGRGGGTGAAPLLFRDHISVPTIPALARARAVLDDLGASGRVTLIVTGGLRTPPDYIKALALGADGIALANAAMQAIGCVGARMCHTNQCPAGIATQDPKLRARLSVDHASERLTRFLLASTELMRVMARACGHARLADFSVDDLTSWKKEVAELAGIPWAGPHR